MLQRPKKSNLDMQNNILLAGGGASPLHRSALQQHQQQREMLQSQQWPSNVMLPHVHAPATPVATASPPPPSIVATPAAALATSTVAKSPLFATPVGRGIPQHAGDSDVYIASPMDIGSSNKKKNSMNSNNNNNNNADYENNNNNRKNNSHNHNMEANNNNERSALLDRKTMLYTYYTPKRISKRRQEMDGYDNDENDTATWRDIVDVQTTHNYAKSGHQQLQQISSNSFQNLQHDDDDDGEDDDDDGDGDGDDQDERFDDDNEYYGVNGDEEDTNDSDKFRGRMDSNKNIPNNNNNNNKKKKNNNTDNNANNDDEFGDEMDVDVEYDEMRQMLQHQEVPQIPNRDSERERRVVWRTGRGNSTKTSSLIHRGNAAVAAAATATATATEITEELNGTMRGTTEPATAPDHHARRPMNAFLIFCKRHRKIVKDRNRTLENRAITKILGDWWASLDSDQKRPYTDLAQQNKDAFFSAHPNFKWYKLPAPPLRTHTTRPTTVTAANGETEEHEETELLDIVGASGTTSVAAPLQQESDNVFRMAEVHQMGELSMLLEDPNIDNNPNQVALQQALGETKQFLNDHMPSTSQTTKMNVKRQLDFVDSSPNNNNSYENNSNNRSDGDNDVGDNININNNINNNNNSNNNSFDQILARKRSRSCKGKKYQELINSGQIAAVPKKSKTSLAIGLSSPSNLNFETNSTPNLNSNLNSKQRIPKAPPPLNSSIVFNLYPSHVLDLPISQSTTSSSSSSPGSSSSSPPPPQPPPPPPISEQQATVSSDLVEQQEFDLEERINLLPALNLDGYLLGKRNSKKKKKLATRKRKSLAMDQHNHQHHQTSSSSVTAAAAAAEPTGSLVSHSSSSLNSTQSSSVMESRKRPNPSAIPPAVVGSQKRKARKESITRRDVSAIENEVAAIIALNGADLEMNLSDVNETANNHHISNTGGMRVKRSNANANAAAIVLSNDLQTQNGVVAAAVNATADNSMSADLFILAEVAANHPELG